MLLRVIIFIVMQAADTAYAAGRARHINASKIDGFHAYCLVAIIVFVLVMLSTLLRDIKRIQNKSLLFKGLIADMLWTAIPFVILAALSAAIFVALK